MAKPRVRHAVVQPLGESYRFIPLTQNQTAVVDSSDFDWLSRWNWAAHWTKKTKSFHAVRWDGKNLVRMHRVIIEALPRAPVDHWNHDTLDNRRENLRTCSQSQNNYNARKRSDNTSGFKGVSWSKQKQKWRALIHVNQRQKHVGFFNSALEAARAYDEAAKEQYKEFAYLNFPDHV